MNYRNNFLDILFNEKKIINIKDEEDQSEAVLLPSQRTLVFSAPLEKEEEKTLLMNILTSCRLKADDYLIAAPSLPYAYFNAGQHIKEALIFGVPEQELGLSVYFPYNCCFPFNERIIIKTGTIAEIMASKPLKNELWQQALKPHFIPVS